MTAAGEVLKQLGKEATGSDSIVRLQVKIPDIGGVPRFAQIDVPKRLAKRFHVGRKVTVGLSLVYNYET